MNDKKISKIVTLAIIIIMLIPIGIQIKNNLPFRKIKTNYVETAIKLTNNYKLAFIYADSKNEKTEDNKDSLKSIVKKLKENGIEIKTYYIDTKKANQKELEKYSMDKNGSYSFIFNGEILKTVGIDTEIETLNKYFGLYTNTNTDKEFVSYKVAKDAKEFIDLIKRKNDITIAIFGRNNCYYCNQYLPVYNTVAEENNLDIYYFDSMSYSQEEYSKVVNSGLIIPAACTSNRTETPLNELASTPLTLFIKDNKTIDCIAGYTNKASLITKLQTLGIIDIEK